MSNTPKQENRDPNNATEKKERQKLILARAKRIQAARKAAEAEKDVAERKARMARRAEAKKRAEELRKAKKAETKNRPKEKEENIDVYSLNREEQHNEDEYIEMGITLRKYKSLPTKKFLQRKFWVNPSAYIIQSYIPGTIISIFVKEGKVVKEGTPLLILEAMKMQNTVEMPFTAKIKSINVAVGQKVPKDHILIELSPV